MVLLVMPAVAKVVIWGNESCIIGDTPGEDWRSKIIAPKEEQYFDVFDVDKSEGLDFSEFLTLMDRRFTHEQFDKNDNQLLEMNEIRHLLLSIIRAPEILKALVSSNLNASAGSDGITSMVYKKC